MNRGLNKQFKGLMDVTCKKRRSRSVCGKIKEDRIKYLYPRFSAQFSKMHRRN
jgi:hypothetical protein